MNTDTPSFDQLELGQPVLKALQDVGYEKPSPIQAQTIPVLLQGRDVLGQAQTGTGKTAAFALPALTQIDTNNKAPQVLVLTPTRELAIQVAEAFKTYAAHIKGFHVLPVYGGQDYRVQTRALERGVQVIVGTPGRIMDHMRRGNIKLHALRMFTLDEADEMLRMGFIDDVEWILEKLPEKKQTALFSATMPRQIARIAERYLNDPEVVQIEVKTQTADTIRQRFWPVTGRNKMDALTRILEAEEFDAMLVFVRTKTSTVEIADKLEARGYASAPLNGDIQQKQRERTVEQLKSGRLDIIVATDVAARGLDVSRISHVLNYDIPSDTEAYIHRIGRTGRAGRKGEAILFVAPREKRMMQSIERATRQSIEQMVLPSDADLNKQRMERFKNRIKLTIESENLNFHEKLIEQYLSENPDHSATRVAAALALQQQNEMTVSYGAQNKPRQAHEERNQHDDRKRSYEDRSPRRQSQDEFSHRKDRKQREKPAHDQPRSKHDSDRRTPHTDKQHANKQPSAKPVRSQGPSNKPKHGMEQYQLAVGESHGVKPANIVGAIANESGIESQYIGAVKIYDDHSTIELPEGMPKAIYKDLKKVWVCGQKLQITKMTTPARSKDSSKFDKEDTTGRSGGDRAVRPHAQKSDRKFQPADSGKRFGAKKRNSSGKAFGHKGANNKGPGNKNQASGGKSSQDFKKKRSKQSS